MLEPGYYEDGAFGIRIENVLLVKPVELEVKKHYVELTFILFVMMLVSFLS